jgi:thiamine biosynthesis lipoprotein
MSSPTAVPSLDARRTGLTIEGLWHSAFRSMASPVRVQLGPDTAEPHRWHERVRTLFGKVDEQCTRFDPRSDLMRANHAGQRWCSVGSYCFDALRAAHHAYLATDGIFDPRVLRALVDLGYDRTLPFADGVDLGARAEVAYPARTAWEPDFDLRRLRVRVGPEPIDLGGIGKGLALRWAADLLRDGGCTKFLVDAGGDCVYSGGGPDGAGWRIGVDDPAGGALPIAVLQVVDGACATSSVRLLSWRVGARTVHHLIDPRTGRPGDSDLMSVTVCAGDPASAEVWSKVLFLQGSQVDTIARACDLAALWIKSEGAFEESAAMTPSVIWRRP